LIELDALLRALRRAPVFPPFEESRANWDKLSESERHHVEQIESFSGRICQPQARIMSTTDGDSRAIIALEWDKAGTET